MQSLLPWRSCLVASLIFCHNSAEAQPKVSPEVAEWLQAAGELCGTVHTLSRDDYKVGGEASPNFKNFLLSFFKLSGSMERERVEERSFSVEALKDLAGPATAILMEQSKCVQMFVPLVVDVLQSRQQGEKRVVAIDSIGYGGEDADINEDNLKDTNADEIERILTDAGVTQSADVFAVRAWPDWNAETAIYLRPQVAFLHWSAFEGENCPAGTREPLKIDSCITLFDAIDRILRETEAIIVLYSRTKGFCNAARKTILSNGRIDRRHYKRIVFLDMTSENRGSVFTSKASETDIAWLTRQLLTSGRLDGNRDGICPLA